MQKTGSKIIVRLPIEGTHQWKGCGIEEVKFLANEHRHIFYIEAKKRVSHLDRDIEIIQFKRSIIDYLLERYYDNATHYCHFGNMSCEMIAQELIEQFGLCSCAVMEDNENGAEIEILDSM